MTFLLPPLFSARRQLTLRSIFIYFSLKNLLTCVNTYIGGIAISNDSPNETKNIRLYAVQCGTVFSKSGMPYGQKFERPAGTVPRHHGLGQGAWLVLTGRCGCPRWVQLLGAGLAVVAVDTEALIWELVWMDFLTLRGDPGLYGHAA